jgi:hypothetical protein
MARRRHWGDLNQLLGEARAIDIGEVDDRRTISRDQARATTSCLIPATLSRGVMRRLGE